MLRRLCYSRTARRNTHASEKSRSTRLLDTRVCVTAVKARGMCSAKGKRKRKEKGLKTLD